MTDDSTAYEGVDFEIGSTYDWCIRAFAVVKNRLGLNIKFHHDEGQVESGQIFLFNHFARFETIIPHYLIHQATGAYCRSVVASELFHVSEKFSKFLFSVGALPNDLPNLLPFLAAEILRGRKVVVFPEGGMVKDRQVIDNKGNYSIFSPTAHVMRKHHAGAAVIALTLEVFKKRILSVHEAGEWDRLDRWVQSVGLESTEALLEAARKPTLIVPANITFYPLRLSENVLTKGIEMFGGELTGRALEELSAGVGQPHLVTARHRVRTHVLHAGRKQAGQRLGQNTLDAPHVGDQGLFAQVRGHAPNHARHRGALRP